MVVIFSTIISDNLFRYSVTVFFLYLSVLRGLLIRFNNHLDCEKKSRILFDFLVTICYMAVYLFLSPPFRIYLVFAVLFSSVILVL